MNKIFGLGLSHTATRSLDRALSQLGYRVLHWPLDRRTHEELSGGRYELTVMKDQDALTDITTVPFFKELDKAYPGSRFILTVREKNAWMESMSKLNNRWLEATKDPLKRFWRQYRIESRYGRNPLRHAADALEHLRTAEFVRRATYGGLAFADVRPLGDVYDAYHRRVMEYFRDRPQDLLVMDICAGEGWEKLCPFLGKAVPTAPFPHHKSRWTEFQNSPQPEESEE